MIDVCDDGDVAQFHRPNNINDYENDFAAATISSAINRSADYSGEYQEYKRRFESPLTRMDATPIPTNKLPIHYGYCLYFN